MAILMSRISHLILQQLQNGEKGILALVVSVRKALIDSGGVKGDLTQMVKSALSQLVASKEVIEMDGWYSLRLLK
jgi:hypothetical protein